MTWYIPPLHVSHTHTHTLLTCAWCLCCCVCNLEFWWRWSDVFRSLEMCLMLIRCWSTLQPSKCSLKKTCRDSLIISRVITSHLTCTWSTGEFGRITRYTPHVACLWSIISCRCLCLNRIFTLYSKSLPLDVACRVWDVFCRDGEEFLFRTGLGILRLYEEVLLQMDFIHIAQFLSRLPEDTQPERLFSCIANTHMVSGNRKWTQVSSCLSAYLSASVWNQTEY